MTYKPYEYVGFWARGGAWIVDMILLWIVTLPILYAVYGSGYFVSEPTVKGPVDFLLSYVFPAVAVVAFWVARQATPGKMLISAIIVDAKTGGKPTTGQFMLRYLGYVVSALPLLLGYVWIGIDSRKQGWHDKIAGTIVIRPKLPEIPVKND